MHRQMRVVHEGGEETGLGSLLSAPAQRLVATTDRAFQLVISDGPLARFGSNTDDCVSS